MTKRDETYVLGWTSPETSQEWEDRIRHVEHNLAQVVVGFIMVVFGS